MCAQLTQCCLVDVRPMIQLLVLRYVARRRLHHRCMRRARVMLSFFKWHRRAQESITCRRAEQHANRKLMLRLIQEWRMFALDEILDSGALAERGEVFFEHALMKTHLNAWIRFMAPSRAKEASGSARAEEWRRNKCREVLFIRWRDNVRKIARRRAKSTELLIFMLPLGFENSSPQKLRANKALGFHRRNSQMKAWEAFIALDSDLADLRRRSKVIAHKRHHSPGEPHFCSA